jgi:hypothetical protein
MNDIYPTENPTPLDKHALECSLVSLEPAFIKLAITVDHATLTLADFSAYNPFSFVDIPILKLDRPSFFSILIEDH